MPGESVLLMNHPTRREFLALGGAAAAAWLGTDPATLWRAFAAAQEAVRSGAPPQLERLTPAQAADLEAIAEQIVPGDDMPGARDARVIVFIDRWLGLASQQGQRDSLLEGLDALNRRAKERWPNGGRFAELADGQQREMLTSIESEPFFRQIRFLTILGMFAHPSWGGNHEQAGWRVLGFEPRYTWQPPFGYYDAEAAREEGR